MGSRSWGRELWEEGSAGRTSVQDRNPAGMEPVTQSQNEKMRQSLGSWKSGQSEPGKIFPRL